MAVLFLCSQYSALDHTNERWEHDLLESLSLSLSLCPGRRTLLGGLQKKAYSSNLLHSQGLRYGTEGSGMLTYGAMLRACPVPVTQREPLRTQGLASHPDLLTDLPLTEELGLFHSSLVVWIPLHALHLGVSCLMEKEDLVLKNII